MHPNPRTPHPCACPARGWSQPGRHRPVLTGDNLIFFVAANVWNPAGVWKQPSVSAQGSQGLLCIPGNSGNYFQGCKNLGKIQSWQELLDVSVCPLLLPWKHQIMEPHRTFLSLLPSWIHQVQPPPILGAHGDLHKTHTQVSCLLLSTCCWNDAVLRGGNDQPTIKLFSRG